MFYKICEEKAGVLGENMPSHPSPEVGRPSRAFSLPGRPVCHLHARQRGGEGQSWTPTRQVHVRNASTPPQLWEPSKGPDVGSMRYYPREADSPGDQRMGAGVGRKQTIYNARQGAQGDADCRDQGVSDSCHLFISDVTTEPPACHRAPSSQCGEGNSRRVDCGSQVTRNFHVDCNIRSQRVPPGAGSLL